MSDALTRWNGLTLAELQAGQRALSQAMMGGTLSVRYADGSQVTYRSATDLAAAMDYVSALIARALPGDAAVQPIRAFRVRPWNGYR